MTTFTEDETTKHEADDTFVLSYLNSLNDKHNLLDQQDTTIELSDNFILSFRQKREQRTAGRLCLCVTLFTGLILATVITFLSAFIYQENQTKLEIKVELIWTTGLPKLITETSFRLLDSNKDGVLDIVFGYGTGVDTLIPNRLLCDIYFDGSYPCNGGVMLLDGRNGEVRWNFDGSQHEVFALNCERDIDKDGILDCLTGGRGGTFEAISGQSGKLIWTFDNEVRSEKMNFYTPLYIHDVDHDGLDDIVTVHGGDPTRNPHEKVRIPGEILLVSSKSGQLLNVSIVPDKMESYYSPQLITRKKGEQFILIGTGGETHGGGLFAFNLQCFTSRCNEPYIKIISDDYKGVMTPPVLVDVNKDNVDDIIIPLYNSTLFAFDGQTFKQLWNYTFFSSETYSTPAVAYFNDDDVPDIMIHYQQGPGYPLYYSAQTTILDGLTGKPLLNKPMEHTIGAQSSPLTISFNKRGTDMFLFWLGGCDNMTNGTRREIEYEKNMPSFILSHANICKLQYHTTSYTALYALSNSMEPPGTVIYHSNENAAVEHGAWVNTSLDVQKFLSRFPNYTEIYDDWQSLENYVQENDSMITPKLNELNPPQTNLNGVDNSDESLLNDDSNVEFLTGEEYDSDRSARKHYKRRKRHVGPHDDGGVQRMISTDLQHGKSSIDIIFATYWINSDTSLLLRPDEKRCINEGMANEHLRLNGNDGLYVGMDHDAYEHYIEEKCRNHTRLINTALKISPELVDSIRTSISNPFKKQMGQLTVYRLRLHFRNCPIRKNKFSFKREHLCDEVEVASFNEQIWAGYMGSRGDCHANNRQPNNMRK
ncbi:unnamed protein product [Didymodactylos carnosus]|uniref:FAM234A/B beta-propeller domain-containing protein n=1 Tax=Didymodactylos carnosus TaxID=1234261 RepID=A0A8S2GQ54_9BILA|nr:unnamed protein product [Didymodactylos carnosus]CAF3544307.1 unnamed protein product [Didymodactylos carnosus]